MPSDPKPRRPSRSNSPPKAARRGNASQRGSGRFERKPGAPSFRSDAGGRNEPRGRGGPSRDRAEEGESRQGQRSSTQRPSFRTSGSRRSSPATSRSGTTSDRGRRRETEPRKQPFERPDRPRGQAKRRPSAVDRRDPINASWGGVARRGAAHMRSEAARSAPRSRPRTERGPDQGSPAPNTTARPRIRYRVFGAGFDQSPTRPRERSRSAAKRTRPVRMRSRATLQDVRAELAASAAPRKVGSMEVRLAQAVRAYERDRYRDALTTLRGLGRVAPDAPAVRELLGLTLYRLGDWKGALRELRRFGELSGSADQLPVVADCERALGHHERVAELWTELRRSGAASDVLVEGRLVAAGSLADQGRISEAIALIGPSATRSLRRPQAQHVRQWYLLGDLYERAGDIPRARQMFERVVATDPDTADASKRLALLGKRTAPRPSRGRSKVGSNPVGARTRQRRQGG